MGKRKLRKEQKKQAKRRKRIEAVLQKCVHQYEGTIETVGPSEFNKAQTVYSTIEIRDKDGRLTMLRNVRVASPLTPYIKPGTQGKFLRYMNQLVGIDLNGEKRVAGWLSPREGESAPPYIGGCIVPILAVSALGSLIGSDGNWLVGLLGFFGFGVPLWLIFKFARFVSDESIAVDALREIGWGPDDCIVFSEKG